MAHLYEISRRDEKVRDPRRDAETFWARPRRTGLRPRRDRDVEHFVRDETETLVCLETVSRPRRRDRDHIPALWSLNICHEFDFCYNLHSLYFRRRLRLISSYILLHYKAMLNRFEKFLKVERFMLIVKIRCVQFIDLSVFCDKVQTSTFRACLHHIVVFYLTKFAFPRMCWSSQWH